MIESRIFQWNNLIQISPEKYFDLTQFLKNHKILSKFKDKLKNASNHLSNNSEDDLIFIKETNRILSFYK